MKTKEQVLKFLSDKRVSDKTIDEVTGTLFINGDYDLAIAMRNAIAKREVLTTDSFFDWYNSGEKEKVFITQEDLCESFKDKEDKELISLIDEYVNKYESIDDKFEKSFHEPFVRFFKGIKKDILNNK